MNTTVYGPINDETKLPKEFDNGNYHELQTYNHVTHSEKQFISKSIDAIVSKCVELSSYACDCTLLTRKNGDIFMGSQGDFND